MASEREIQIFRDLLEKWVDQDRAKRLIRDARTPAEEPIRKETLVERIQREGQELETQLDKWIKEEEWRVVEEEKKGKLQRVWEAVSEFWEEKKLKLEAKKPWETFGEGFKRELTNLWKLWVNVWTDVAQLWGDTLDFVWEVIDDPWQKIEDAKTLWQWFLWLIRKAWRLWLELGTWKEITDISKEEQIANKIWEWISREAKDKFGTKEKAVETLTQNPLDVFLFVRGWLKGLKDAWLSKTDKKKIEKLTEEADQQIEQFLKPTKKTTKQVTAEISPELQKRLTTGKITPADRKVVLEQTQKEIDRVWKDIWEFIEKGRVKGEIDLSEMVNTLAKEDSKLRLDGQIIPWNEAQAKFITAQLEFLAALERAYGKNLPAAKQLELKQKYDVVFDKAVTRDKITKFQDDLQVKLADTLRAELAKNNPDLDKLNKEYSFNKWLELVLEETIERTRWQDPVWLITELRGASQGTLWAAVWAWIGWTVWWPLWATVWAIMWGATWAKLTKVLGSPKYKLLSAKKKAELADAIAKWNKTKVDKILDWMTVTLWISIVSEDE